MIKAECQWYNYNLILSDDMPVFLNTQVKKGQEVRVVETDKDNAPTGREMIAAAIKVGAMGRGVWAVRFQVIRELEGEE